MADDRDASLPVVPPGYVWRPQPRESVIDPAELASRLEYVPERPTVRGALDDAKALRDELVALGGEPTRALRTVTPDPVNPAYESDELILEAENEWSYWAGELETWKRFLRWRMLQSERRKGDAPTAKEPPLAVPHGVDAYALHIELRAYLLECIETKQHYRATWLGSRARIKTLEPQLAEMRAERKLPADDNPPPPALVALWAAEEAKKAAELATVLVPSDPLSFRRQLRGKPSNTPPRKRKRDEAAGSSDDGTATSQAAKGAEMQTSELSAGRPSKRRAPKRAPRPATKSDEPRRSKRIAVLPRKNYKA